MTVAFTVTNSSPWVDYEHVDELDVAIIRYAGTATEQRAKTQDIARRRYTWHMRATSSERQNINEFFRQRSYSVQAFYVRDPKDSSRTGVDLDTSVSGQTSFTLPVAGENKRDYPISGATATVYDDGSPTAASVTIDTDNRKFILSAAPTTGSVMTVDFKAYRLVRLDEPLNWTGLAPDWYECSPVFVEVPA